MMPHCAATPLQRYRKGHFRQGFDLFGNQARRSVAQVAMPSGGAAKSPSARFRHAIRGFAAGQKFGIEAADFGVLPANQASINALTSGAS
jgi:hypothetical protein